MKPAEPHSELTGWRESLDWGLQCALCSSADNDNIEDVLVQCIRNEKLLK